ncbi:MAG: mechanosensitive ion channel family protein [Candidatus Eiseniibacteriota bacterium]
MMTHDGFFGPLLRSIEVLLDTLPRVFALVAIVFLGLLLAWAVRQVSRPIFASLRLEALSRRLGLTGAFAGIRIDRPLSEILADTLWMLVFLVFVVVGLDALDPTSAGRLVQEFYAFLPRILISALILIAGWAVSVFVAQAALLTAVNAGFRLARPIAIALQFLVVAIALAMALEQLGIAQGIVIAAFVVAFGGIVLALALAFGLGGVEFARRALERRLGPLGEGGREDDISHV